MPNHLSILGIIHTAISVLALFAAIACLLRDGRVNPTNGAGRLYIWLTIITCVTGFPIMKTGHFTPGHYVAIIIIVLLPIGIYAKQLRIFGKVADYAQIIVLSTTIFLSFVPAIVETLTRLPIAAPIAADANAPVIQMGLNILAVLYFGGVIYQVLKLRAKKKKGTQSPDGSINMG